MLSLYWSWYKIESSCKYVKNVFLVKQRLQITQPITSKNCVYELYTVMNICSTEL